MIFVLTIINNVNNICKNENHWSLLISRYSLLIARNTITPVAFSLLYRQYLISGSIVMRFTIYEVVREPTP